MSVRDLMRRWSPAAARQLFHRGRWFLRNYNLINSGSVLFNAVHGPPRYNTDGLCTSNDCSFIETQRFRQAYELAAGTNPWEGFTLQWRVFVYCWFARHALQTAGVFVECGVNTGAYARAAIDFAEVERHGRRFWLFDTFRGLEPSLVSEAEIAAGIGQYFGAYRDVYEEVTRTFAGLPVEVIRGVVPDSLQAFGGEPVCFLSIDMNCAAPEIAALEFFWPFLSPGGVVVLDDYGFPQHVHQRRAFDAFAADRALEVLALPTGQGILFKPLLATHREGG